jgi:RNA polymerase sigma factor (sigma-70 family)
MNPEVEHRLRVLLLMLTRDRDDQEAWTALYGLVQPFVWNISLKILWRNPEAARDATQVTFQRLATYGDFRKYPLPDQFMPYLATVAKHVAWDMLKEQTARAANEEAAAAEAEKLRVQPAQIERNRWLLKTILSELDTEERQVVDLLMEGWSVGEIAEKIGLSYTAAGVRIHRLRQALLRLLVC